MSQWLFLKYQRDFNYKIKDVFREFIGCLQNTKKSILKHKNKQKKLSTKSWKHETKVYANPGLG